MRHYRDGSLFSNSSHPATVRSHTIIASVLMLHHILIHAYDQPREVGNRRSDNVP